MSHILSIITVAFNERNHVTRLQQSIDCLGKPNSVTIESILVDGGSRDGTPDAARQAGFSKIVEIPNATIPICRNKGLQAARGDWIAFVDADCELAPDWLEQALPFLEKNDAVLLGWPARPPEPMTWVQAAWLFHWTQKNPQLENFQGIPVVQHEGFRLTTTRNMLLHRTVADRIGGFNEELVTGEDTDFAYRAYIENISVLGVPTLEVIHHGEPATLRDFFKQQLWHANRKSYKHIFKTSGGRIGGNAPRFAAAFLIALLLFLAAPVATALTHQKFLFILMLGLPVLIAGPAFLLCERAKNLKPFFALSILYFAYGLARSLDLLGFVPAKPSWKTKPPNA